MSVHPSAAWLRAAHTDANVVRLVRPTPGPLARFKHGLAALRRRVRERRELDGMSNAELRDIGITRADIPRVFGPAFAREYAMRGRFTQSRGDRP
jgi:uncharacterized protein YjiS (DUF1127 family)